MTKHGPERVPQSLQAVRKIVGIERTLFVCVHKDNRELAEGALRKSGVPAELATASVGHFWAVDGRNDSKGHDAALLIGIPFISDVPAQNTFYAVQGPSAGTKVEDMSWRSYPSIREALIRTRAVLSFVQALNRVRCRRVVDDQGNCAPTESFVCFPRGGDGDQILAGIQDEMPGLDVRG